MYKLFNIDIGSKEGTEHKLRVSEHNARYFKGKHFSEEHRKRISEAKKGKKSIRKGKHLSDEHRKHISEHNANKRKIHCITTRETFDSMKEAADKYNTHQSNISACCKGKYKSAGKLPDGTKLQWRYVDNDTD